MAQLPSLSHCGSHAQGWESLETLGGAVSERSQACTHTLHRPHHQCPLQCYRLGSESQNESEPYGFSFGGQLGPPDRTK